MTSESGLALRRRARKLAALALIAAATLAASGDANERAPREAHRELGAPAASERAPVADRTLVPKRIRLIIGWKRPRLA